MAGFEDSSAFFFFFLKTILILSQVEIGVELHHFGSQGFLMTCQLHSWTIAVSGRKLFRIASVTAIK